MGPGVLSDILSNLPKIKDDNILVGFESSDDACVYKVNDDVALINSIDFFPPIVDDPYMFGQIAAANSLSDIYAMGGTPKLAMNLLTFPNCLPIDAVKEILAGGNDKVTEAGATIVGGHSINDDEPKYGLSVTGFARPKDIRANTGLAGDLLIITKKIGTGILSTASKANLLTPKEESDMIQTMAELNRKAYEATIGIPINGSTDITGFGLLGHGIEMAKTGNLTIEIFAEHIPVLNGVLDFAKTGILPAGVHNNMQYLENDVIDYTVGLKRENIDILYDPQTSGGLLFAVNKKYAKELQNRLSDAGLENAIIGQFKEKTSHFGEIINK